MNLDEIKTAIEAGHTVHWSNSGYTVVKTGDQYLIRHTNGHCIGLTWADNITLNGKEADFYLTHKTDFKVHKRTIEVYRNGTYLHSTNAYRLCREAADAARKLYPNTLIVARFVK